MDEVIFDNLMGAIRGVAKLIGLKDYDIDYLVKGVDLIPCVYCTEFLHEEYKTGKITKYRCDTCEGEWEI